MSLLAALKLGNGLGERQPAECFVRKLPGPVFVPLRQLLGLGPPAADPSDRGPRARPLLKCEPLAVTGPGDAVVALGTDGVGLLASSRHSQISWFSGTVAGFSQPAARLAAGFLAGFFLAMVLGCAALAAAASVAAALMGVTVADLPFSELLAGAWGWLAVLSKLGVPRYRIARIPACEQRGEGPGQASFAGPMWCVCGGGCGDRRHPGRADGPPRAFHAERGDALSARCGGSRPGDREFAEQVGRQRGVAKTIA